MTTEVKILLSTKARNLLRSASSGLSGVEWNDIPAYEKKLYTAKQDSIIESLMLEEPDSFTRRAIAYAKDVRKRRMARTNAQTQAKVQEAEVPVEN